MGRRCPTGVAFSEDGFVVEAELIAQKLGLSPDAFWREMKRGIVYGVVSSGAKATSVATSWVCQSTFSGFAPDSFSMTLTAWA